MLKIKILCVGKAKGDWANSAAEHFEKMLKRSCKLEILELPESKTGRDGSIESLKSAEGDTLLAKLGEKKSSQSIWALEVTGESFTSENFAKSFQQEMSGGVSEIIFVIGGAYGLDSRVSAKADRSFSLSTLTLSHQIARVALLEQIYRAFSILAGTAYHK